MGAPISVAGETSLAETDCHTHTLDFRLKLFKWLYVLARSVGVVDHLTSARYSTRRDSIAIVEIDWRAIWAHISHSVTSSFAEVLRY